MIFEVLMSSMKETVTSIIWPEDGGSRSLRNIAVLLSCYTALNPRTQQSQKLSILKIRKRQLREAEKLGHAKHITVIWLRCGGKVEGAR
jgi:hypothetical protein